ncbi:hypothetical protein LSAT2_025176 [Lamellibrachia satsuma]|nr:hypothetical protein LSAT2_025176 [Lamellibrachia satsuma]
MVRPLQKSALERELRALLGPTPSAVARVAAQGDGTRCNELFMKVATGLNCQLTDSLPSYGGDIAVKKTSTGYGPAYTASTHEQTPEDPSSEETREKYEEDRDKRAKVRTEMIVSLTGLTKQTLNTIKLVTSTLNIITRPTEEVSRPAQVCTLNIITHPTEEVSRPAQICTLNITTHPTEEVSRLAQVCTLNIITRPTEEVSRPAQVCTLNIITRPTEEVSRPAQVCTLNIITHPTDEVSRPAQVCTLNIITHPTEEVSRPAQKALAVSLGEMADTVAKLAATAPKELLVSTVASLIETSGNILEASTFAIDNGLLRDIDAAAETDYYYYDTNWESKREPPENFQKIVKDVLRDCKGAANIADDVIVLGRGVKEHDENLFDVLNRLKESGLTLNGSKCKFRLP